MRNLLLLSAAVLLAACSDDHTTAPASASRNRATTQLGDTRVSTQFASAQGKPTDAVGFTKITQVLASGGFAPGQSGTVHADCPAGTTVINGGFGYNYPGAVPTVAAPSMLSAGIVGNTWSIVIANNQPGAIGWVLDVVAYCAS